MGRVSRAEAAKHREEVVTSAARLFRERGVGAVSVQDVSAAVGLTHGGFYKNFASKEALAGLAATDAFGDDLERMVAGTSDAAGARDALLVEYLRAGHRDAPGEGCALTGFAADSARTGDESPLRRSYTEGAKAILARLEEYQDERDGGTDSRARAIVELATMVGALTLARATAGDPLSDEILDSVRAALLSR
ncbi:TetR/AcrR family transcriptional regulator [Micromonospora sp. NPDC050397]|uniref:TetR/AcrR family transcriptional regulator n=1 Tax=Micromonospora sp. NPDC050397 TaxID=3364279 RepID=UPI00384CC9D9